MDSTVGRISTESELLATLLKRFSERLYFLRSQRELTQEALAHGAKLHPGYISALERGMKMPTLHTLERLANGLKIEVRDLLDFPDTGTVQDDRANDDIKLLIDRLKKCDPKTVQRIRKAVEVLTAP